VKKHRPRPRKPKPPRAKVEPAERREDGSLVFYHGGPGWLNVGDFILPRGLTGADGARADWPEAYVTAAGVEDVDDADWVHITTNSKLAARFAVLHKSGNGKVFRVSPEGKIEPDQTRAQAQDCWRCSRAQIVAIEVIPYQDAQKIRAERPKNFDEAADDFEQFVKDDAETLRRAQENALIAGQNLVEQKVGELATSDLSPRFIATELLAHAIHMLVPSCEILFARILAAKHWETVLSTLPVEMRA
jgi:hypothetical protein